MTEPMRPGTRLSALLREGRNCWRIAPASRMSVLVDGQAYFAALRQALCQARHTVFILGWDIDSRMVLQPEGAADGMPHGLRDFLDALVRRRATLRIHVLSWDFAMLYALEREWLPAVKLDWHTHRRLTFRLDGKHPAGASHHQKVVVIDGRLAFVGGLDLTRCRWDTPRHAAQEPARRDPVGRPYPPFHDVQAMVDGPAAAALGELAAARWRRATGAEVAVAPRGSREDRQRSQEDPWPADVAPDLTDVHVGISRTEPPFGGAPAVHEIRDLYLDAIAAAQARIYLENQYFTATPIGDALAARLHSPHCPDIALVSRRTESGWLQEQSMGVLRARLYRRLREADPEGRFRLYCPEVPGVAPACVNVHSKLMIVDDALLTIGSANLNNRSMGLDTECNLTVEADGDPRIAAGINRIRTRLLAEHLGVPADTVDAALAGDAGLHRALQALYRPGERTLEAFAPSVSEQTEAAMPSADLLDPIEPVDLETVMAEFLTHEERPRVAGRIVLLLALLLCLAGLALAWRYTPLRAWADVGRMMAFVRHVATLPMAPLAMMGLYVVGALAMVPVTVLIIVTVVVFGPVAGALYALCGTLLGALAGYVVGRVAGRDAVRRFGGRRLNRLNRQIGNHGLLAMVVLRLMPLAPFTLVNLVVGASRIGLRDYLLGTVAGMAPGILIAASLVDRVAALARRPSAATAILFALVLLLPALGAALLKRSLAARASPEAASARPRETACSSAAHGEIRVASYNIHGGIGTDGHFVPQRIAQVLDEMDSDIVALQEVESDETGFDMLAFLARERQYHAVPGPTLRRGGVHYGNALLTRFAPISLRHIDLSVPGYEPRGAIDAMLERRDATGRAAPLRVIATHLGLRPGERRQQVKRLLQCLASQPGLPTVLLGDVNEWFLWGRPLRWLHAYFDNTPHVRTFPSHWPLLALDRLWVSPRAHLVGVRRHASPLARRASDHLPLVARLCVAQAADSEDARDDVEAAKETEAIRAAVSSPSPETR